jgi:hypothetical protein
MRSEKNTSKPDGTEPTRVLVQLPPALRVKMAALRASRGPREKPLTNKQFIAAFEKRVQELHAEHRAQKR